MKKNKRYITHMRLMNIGCIQPQTEGNMKYSEMDEYSLGHFHTQTTMAKEEQERLKEKNVIQAKLLMAIGN